MIKYYTSITYRYLFASIFYAFSVHETYQRYQTARKAESFADKANNIIRIFINELVFWNLRMGSLFRRMSSDDEGEENIFRHRRN